MMPENGSPERAEILVERIDKVIAWMDAEAKKLVEIMEAHPETIDSVHDVLSAYVRPVLLMRSVRRHLIAQIGKE